MNLRVKSVHGRHLLCGGILNRKHLEIGQLWASADGSNRTVEIIAVTPGDWVTYQWNNPDGTTTEHRKQAFAFQCRYCLVLPTNEVPGELT